MFPRVTHPSAADPANRSFRGPLDLHVLGLPPAFILSQDQTLKLKRSLNRVLDVRNLCTSLPVSRKHLLLHVLPSPQTQSGIPSRKPQTRPEKPKTHKTVKRSPIIAHRSHGKLERRHTDGLIHRTKPNRPHISSRYNSFKERTNKTPDAAPLLSARPPVICSCFPPRTVRRFVREPLTTKGIAGAQEVFYRNVIFPTRFLWAVGAPAPASRTNPARSHGKAGSPPGQGGGLLRGEGLPPEPQNRMSSSTSMLVFAAARLARPNSRSWIWRSRSIV